MSDVFPSGASRRTADLVTPGAEVIGAAGAERKSEADELATAYAAVFRLNPANPVDPVAIVLADLRKRGFAERTTFVQGQPDQTAVNEGRRQLLTHIENRVSAGNEVLRGERR